MPVDFEGTMVASVASPAETYGALRRFGSLDGLRAFAILGVLWHHCYSIANTPADPFTNAGGSGVALFFVLSGFLITTLLLREWRSKGSVDLSAFYWRRSLRILPLYYATLAAYCVLVAIFERHSAAGRDFFANLPYFITYTNNWFVDLVVNADGERRSIFFFAWTLATEEQFYLLWPPLLLFLGPRRAFFLLGILFVADSLMSSLGLTYSVPENPTQRLLRIATSFSGEIVLGCFLGGTLHYERSFKVVWRLLGQWWSIWVAAALSVWVVTGGTELSTYWRLCQAVLFSFLIGAAVVTPRHGMSWLFDQPILARIGVVSYGMYLLHMLAFHATTLGFGFFGWTEHSGPTVIFLCTCVMAYAAAEISFRWFESPILALKSRPAWFGLGSRNAQASSPK